MANCPYCETEYESYTVVGVLPASEHLTYWLDPLPVAQLCCVSCGRYTFMHPDHPDVQRLSRAHPHGGHRESVRTLNVPVGEIGDPELRDQFEYGRDR